MIAWIVVILLVGIWWELITWRRRDDPEIAKRKAQLMEREKQRKENKVEEECRQLFKRLGQHGKEDDPWKRYYR